MTTRDPSAASVSGAGRVVVLDIADLQQTHLNEGLAPNVAGLLAGKPSGPFEPPLLSVTVPTQTTFLTGQSFAVRGDVSSGEFDRERQVAESWERDRGGRIRLWEVASDEAGLITDVLLFQHLIGTSADVAVTLSSIEDEDNNLIETDCWTTPDSSYDDLREEYGHFPLRNYWRSVADERNSERILAAVREPITRSDPDLLWTYVPHLDYDAQRHGPDSPKLQEAVGVVDDLVGELFDRLETTPHWTKMAVSAVNEYGSNVVDAPVLPNRAPREAGLLVVHNDDAGGGKVDIAGSLALVMVDHQIAHVYIDRPTAARKVLESLPGVDVVLEGEARGDVDHPNADDLVVAADADAQFQYYWWTNDAGAPSYATEISTHVRPGLDSCELFLGNEGFVTLDPTRVSGSHGRIDPDTRGFYGFGGSAVPDGPSDRIVDARRFAPTAADLLGIAEDVSLAFERPSLLVGPQVQVQHHHDALQNCFSAPLDDSKRTIDTKEKLPWTAVGTRLVRSVPA